MAKVLVADVSVYQPDSVAYFKGLYAKGVRSVIIKLTESTNYVNPKAAAQINNALKAGMQSVGAYHFFHGNSVPEARYFAYWLKKLGLDATTPAVVDAEVETVNTANINAFNSTVRSYGYKNTFTYSMNSYFGTRINAAKLTNSKLWVANYSGGFNMDNVTMWQFTDNYAGTSTDMSWCYFPERIGIVSTPVKPKSDKTKIGGNLYYTSGTKFQVVANRVNGYKDSAMRKQSDAYHNKGEVIYGKIAYDGSKYPRIKTKYNNYYSANTDNVKKLN